MAENVAKVFDKMTQKGVREMGGAHLPCTIIHHSFTQVKVVEDGEKRGEENELSGEGSES